jgi:hypothetical protein
MTKPVTSVAARLLAEEGKLQMAAPSADAERHPPASMTADHLPPGVAYGARARSLGGRDG